MRLLALSAPLMVLGLGFSGCGRLFYDPIPSSDAAVNVDGSRDGAVADGAGDSGPADSSTDGSLDGNSGDAAGDGAQDGGLGPPVVFVTSTTIIPNNTTRAQADSTCNVAAGNAGLSGTFLAWYARDGSAAAPLLNSGGWVRTDGRPVARNATQLTQAELIYPIALDEFGVDQRESGFTVATASNPEGDVVEDCDGFTNASGTLTTGKQASTSLRAIEWNSEPCSGSYHLYCFEVGRSASVSIQTMSGRVAFLSTGLFDSASGLANADSICAGEATGSGLSGNFVALLATPGASAIERFAPSPARWVRPDGALIATGTDFAADRLLTTINIHADGSRAAFFDGVASGARFVTSLGTGTSCLGWTTSSSGEIASFGLANDSLDFFGRPGFATGCNLSRKLYCLELPR